MGLQFLSKVYIQNLFVKKYWDEENILFYIHFWDGEEVRQIEKTTKGRVLLIPL